MDAVRQAADAPPATRPQQRLARLLAEPRRVLLVAAVLVSFAACLDVLHDPDLFWHLRLGRWILDNHRVPSQEMFTFTAQGNHLVAHEWGSEVLFTLLNSAGGLLLVAAVMASVAWSSLGALALRAASRGAGPVAIAVALLLGARAAQPVLGTRPQVFTVALVCWGLLLVEQHFVRGTRLVWILAPMTLLIANLHGGFVLGVAALAAAVVLEGVRRVLWPASLVASWRRIGEAGLAVAVSAGLSCLNPDGPNIYRYAFETAGTSRTKPITEWHAPDFHDPSNIGLLLLLVSFPLLVALGGRLNLRDLAMSLGGFAAALLAVRNTTLAVALALPAWGAMLQQVIDRFGSGRRTARRAPASARGGPAVGLGALIVAMALAADGVVVARAADDASPAGVASTYPACATAAMSHADGLRIFATYYVSGYVIDELWPRGHVFIYGESASLGQQVFDDYERILGGGDPASALLAGYRVNVVLIGPGALHDTLASSSDWIMVRTWPVDGTLFARPQIASRIDAQRC